MGRYAAFAGYIRDRRKRAFVKSSVCGQVQGWGWFTFRCRASCEDRMCGGSGGFSKTSGRIMRYTERRSDRTTDMT